MIQFIELKEDKTPINRHKKYSSFENLENAGLLLNDNVVVIDFDNDNKNEDKIIKYIDETYPTLKVTTDKGVHFYYSKPIDIAKIKSTTDTITVGGFQVDYKTGNQYVMVKRNGKVRETNRPLSFENLEELPPLLYPLTKRKDNLSGMVEHDGRNDTLFRHLCSVQSTYADIDLNNIAEFINNITFAESLESKELNSVIDSAISYYNINKNKKDMISFAQWLIPQLNIRTYNTELFFLDNKRYISDNKLLIKSVTQFEKLKKAQDNELLYQLAKLSDEINASLKELPILIRNGLIIDGEYSKIENDNIPFTPFYLDVEYNSNAYDENVDKFLNSITCDSSSEDPTPRKELRQTLEEILGHILLTNKFPAHVFFLSGGGNNGKSTFLEMINNFVGELGQNLSLDAFNDGTSVATLNAKLVNCSDETDDVFIDKCKGYKSLASGNTITVRPIYSQPVKVQNTATLILSANKMPEFKDKSKGFFRRLMIIPFDFVITEKISNLDELLSTDNAKSYILNLALKGVQSIKTNGYKMTTNKYLNEKIDEYILDTDTVRSFLDEKPIIENREIKNVHKEYCLYCMDIGKMSLGLANFSSRLKDYGYFSTPTASRNEEGKSTTIRVYKKVK